MFAQFLDKVLVDNWRSALRFYSLWFYAAIGLLPEIADLAVQFGVVASDSVAVPEFFANLLRWIAFAGALSRLIKQVKPALPADTAPSA